MLTVVKTEVYNSFIDQIFDWGVSVLKAVFIVCTTTVGKLA